MGFALANAAAVRGAEVVLVTGPTTLCNPLNVETIHVESANEMLNVAQEAFENADAAILSAAVCDYRPLSTSDHKLKKDKEHLETLKLEETTDILATLSKDKGQRIVIGFAAETDNLIANAQAKLKRKGCDLIVANDVSCPESTFGSDTNKIYLVDNDGVDEEPCMSKRNTANVIISELVGMFWDREE